MNLSTLTASLAGAAVIGLAPLTAMAAPVHMNARPPAQSSSKLFNFHGRMVAGPFASPRLSSAWSHRLPAQLQHPFGPSTYVYHNGKGKKCKSLLYGSDDNTGNLDQYCEDGTNQSPMKTIAGGGGWGISIEPKSKEMAVGVSGGTITIYDATNLAVTTTLKLSGQTSGYNAYGLCWDDNGGLFATNWPGNTIDYFAGAAGLAAGSGPTSTVATQVGTGGSMEDYYLACDFDKKETGNNGYLMVYAFNIDSITDPAIVADVTNPYNGGTSTVTVSQSLGSLAGGNGFPGGLSINKNDNLLANDQYGFLYDLGTKEPWNGPPPLPYCTWGFNPNDFTNIVWDTKAKEVWASVETFSGTSFLQSVGAPPYNNGSCLTPGESGGPTVTKSGSAYLGVGVYKASAS